MADYPHIMGLSYQCTAHKLSRRMTIGELLCGGSHLRPTTGSQVFRFSLQPAGCFKSPILHQAFHALNLRKQISLLAACRAASGNYAEFFSKAQWSCHGAKMWHEQDEAVLGRTCTLQAGILEREVRPPATPMSLAAISVPTAADRLGAMWCILSCTRRRMSALSASSWSAMSAAPSMRFKFSSDSCFPDVVDAVTDTTMTVACEHVRAHEPPLMSPTPSGEFTCLTTGKHALFPIALGRRQIVLQQDILPLKKSVTCCISFMEPASVSVLQLKVM